MKFEVGDVVRIVHTNNIISDRLKYQIGDTGVIVKIGRGICGEMYFLEGDHPSWWFWLEDELEHDYSFDGLEALL